jgi:hypothetical protein
MSNDKWKMDSKDLTQSQQLSLYKRSLGAQTLFSLAKAGSGYLLLTLG